MTWDTLQKEILEKMRHLLRPGVYIQVGRNSVREQTYRLGGFMNQCVFVQVGPFSLRVVGVVGITYLLPQDERPLCHPTVERSASLFNLKWCFGVKSQMSSVTLCLLLVLCPSSPL